MKMSRRKRKLKRIRLILSLIFFVLLLILIIKGSLLMWSLFCDNDTPDMQEMDNTVQNNTNEVTNNQISTHENDTIYNQLKSMLNKDKRVQRILDNYDSYPSSLLDMLSRNIDILDFVLDYPDKKGHVYADTIENVQQGVIPLLLQWDKRWGYGKYGDSSVAESGCAPTALAMVVVGLTGNNTITPYVVAQYAENNGYYVSGSGSSWGLISEGSQYFGVMATELSLSENNIYNALENGNPIICSMRPGDFTTTGHFIVLVGIKNGKIIVNDPNSREKSKKSWDYQTLQHQINNLWEFH